MTGSDEAGNAQAGQKLEMSEAMMMKSFSHYETGASMPHEGDLR
jgi:hypothetical protein